MTIAVSHKALIAIAAAAVLAIPAGPAAAQAPLPLKIGYTPTGDTQMVLIKLKPEIARHAGKEYTVDFEEFRGTDMRFRAYLSGALTGATGSANSVMAAASKGVDLVVVASLCKESSKGFNTEFRVVDNSPIKSIADLKGKTIGINALNSSTQLWAKVLLDRAGLNPDRDVTFLVMNFAVQPEALRSGKVDVAVLTQPFAHFEDVKGGSHVLFTAKTAMPYDEELQVLFFPRDFLLKNGRVVRAFLEDLVLATKYYLDKPEEARAALVDAKLIDVPKDVYFKMKDYYRAPDAKVDMDSLRQMQDELIKAGYQKERIDPAKLVDMSYLPN
jgi:ABC-type nitrate/sulfonate/bicarbonate transport system substrate-binding protein